MALLGLMYLDMGSNLVTTLKFAAGVAISPLDSARIVLMIWFGVVGRSTAFWGIHDWLGYAIFFAFSIAVWRSTPEQRPTLLSHPKQHLYFDRIGFRTA